MDRGACRKGNDNLYKNSTELKLRDRKIKATDDFTHLSPYVAFSYKLSNKFIEDFERIMDFVEYKHIVLKPHKVGNGIK